MNAAAAGLPHIATAQIIGFVLVLGRLGGLFMLAPIFSSRMIPARVKLFVAGAMSLAITPTAMHGQHLPTDPIDIIPLLIKEVMIGLAFAIAVGALSAGVQAAGTLLDTLIGFSFGALVNPFDTQPAAIMGQLYAIFATMVFLLTGGADIMILGIAKSYEVVPLGAIPPAGQLAALATVGLGQIFVVALAIAAPVAIALLLADVAFALVSRAVPQMNIFAVGLPAKILIGFATVMASLPFVANNVQDQLDDFVLQALLALKI